MRHRLWASTAAALTALAFSAGTFAYAGPALKVHPDSFTVDGIVLGKAIDEAEMDGLRGGYLGVYFSVLFEGTWDDLGNYNANLTSGGNVGTGDPASLSSSLPAGTDVRIQANAGQFGNTRGIFQITQVPGDNNIVQSNMIININIVQVPGTSITDVMGLLPWN